MRGRSNDRKIVTISQLLIFTGCFRCSYGRCCLIKLPNESLSELATPGVLVPSLVKIDSALDVEVLKSSRIEMETIKEKNDLLFQVALEVLSYHSKCSDYEYKNITEIEVMDPYPNMET